jgi:carboxypeptidase family protein
VRRVVQATSMVKHSRREIPRLRVPALRAKEKARDTPLGMTALGPQRIRDGVGICRLWLVAALLFFASAHLEAQGVSTVEIGNVQSARTLAGEVQDDRGSPIAGVSVEELSSNWKVSLRSTRTDAAGDFSFVPVKDRKVYYFQFRMDGFNPLRVRVKVDRKHGKELKLRMFLSN